MSKILNVTDLEIEGKNALVRADLEGDLDSPRFLATRQIVDYLREHQAKRIKVIGHGGDVSQLEELGVDMNWDLRADPREKENDSSLARELAENFDLYINEAFATSHRKQCSIIALPKFIKEQGRQVAIGLRFAKEIEMLSQVFDISDTRRVLVIGGSKVVDKEKYAQDLAAKFEVVLKGGLLPGVKLREDGLDIADEAIEEYKQVIAEAKVIVAAGVMGKYEEAGAEKGTKEILQAIADSSAYKIVGGGDIEAAISKYNLSDKFDWISVGGGAMLEFLATGTLPGLEALVA